MKPMDRSFRCLAAFLIAGRLLRTGASRGRGDRTQR